MSLDKLSTAPFAVNELNNHGSLRAPTHPPGTHMLSFSFGGGWSRASPCSAVARPSLLRRMGQLQLNLLTLGKEPVAPQASAR